MRRSFVLERDPPERLWLCIHHDEDATVWINGVHVATLDGYTSGYVFVPLGDEARAALAHGENVLAMRVMQTGGGQYADVGLAEVGEP
jgi:hypothetical protein